MDQQSTISLDTLFSALADPTRRAVVHRLGRGPASISDLAAPFAMALPSFMKHIRTLEAAGIVSTRKSGRVRHCALERGRLAEMQDWLDAERAVWEGRTDRLDAFVTQAQGDAE